MTAAAEQTQQQRRPGTKVARTEPQQKLVAIVKRLERGTFLDSLKAVLPKEVTPDRVVRTATLALNKNPALLDCTPESIAESVLTVATWRLEIGRTAHIVPYGKSAQAQVDWKGMVELAVRAGTIVSATPRLVYPREVASGAFRVRYGTKQGIQHEPDWGSEVDEPPCAVYCVVTYPGGQTDFELMSRRQIERIRDRYSKAWKREKGKRGPWESDPDEQWKKTAVRLMLKRVPQPPALAAVIEYDESDRAAQMAEYAEIMSGAGRRHNPHVGDVHDNYSGESEIVVDGDGVVIADGSQQQAQQTAPVERASGEVPVTVVNMADKPVPKPPKGEGYPEADVPPMTEEESAALDQELLRREAEGRTQ